MRNSFIGFYPPTEEELKRIWNEGIIVLDANVLLNLYRYSAEARTALLDLLTSLGKQRWLPHQLALEFHRNRLPRIYGERKNCDDFLAGLRAQLKELDESRRHPFVKPAVREHLEKMVEDLVAEIRPSMDELDSFKRTDPILDRITTLYEGKVGAEPDHATRDAWLVEGEDRYRRSIPPGFEDRKKGDERKFGDLFAWKQMLAHAGEKKLPVMFVTDDGKKDWWREQNGETIGPHPSLVAEMVSATGQPFHMYRPERFLEVAGQYRAKPVPAKVVEEVKQARVADERSARSIAKRALLHEQEAMRLTDPFADIRRAQEAMRLADPFADIRRAQEAMRLADPFADIRRAQEAMRLADPFADIRRAQEAMRLADPFADIRRAREADGPTEESQSAGDDADANNPRPNPDE